MTIDWDDYDLYHPGTPAGELAELPRSQARAAFNRLMEAKPARIGMLRRLLGASGVDLDMDEAAVQELNDWFVANVEADPRHPGRLENEWYSVAVDIGLFLGEVLIERHPHLSWEFFTQGKKDVSFQQAVIMGFKGIANAKYNVDFHRQVVGYGHLIVAQRGSVAPDETVTVRGVNIDVPGGGVRGAVEIQSNAFERWFKSAESFA